MPGVFCVLLGSFICILKMLSATSVGIPPFIAFSFAASFFVPIIIYLYLRGNILFIASRLPSQPHGIFNPFETLSTSDLIPVAVVNLCMSSPNPLDFIILSMSTATPSSSSVSYTHLTLPTKA